MMNLSAKWKKMWIVAKIKNNQLQTFKEKFNKNFDNSIKFYYPKISQKCRKFYSEKNILGNYIFCFHEKFSDSKKLNFSKYTLGLEYFLKGYKNSQSQIQEFIDFCKKNENSKGLLMQDFFRRIDSKKCKFLNGPLANIVFEILSKEKKYLNILLGNKEVKVDKNLNIGFLPA